MNDFGYRKIDWKDLGIRERISYMTAILAFIIGFGLVIWGFCVPPIGDVSDSVLFVLGESLVYCSAVFSITTYLTSSARMLKHRMDDRMNDIERGLIQRQELRNNIDEGEIPSN